MCIDAFWIIQRKVILFPCEQWRLFCLCLCQSAGRYQVVLYYRLDSLLLANLHFLLDVYGGMEVGANASCLGKCILYEKGTVVLTVFIDIKNCWKWLEGFSFIISFYPCCWFKNVNQYCFLKLCQAYNIISNVLSDTFQKCNCW